MPTYGVTSTGFLSPTLDEIKAGIENDIRANISPIANLNSNTVIGQLNGIFASKAREIYEAIEATYNANNPDGASGAQLAQLSLITGTERRDATKSQVVCSCNLDAGTYAAGALVAHVLGAPDSRFVNKASVTSPGGLVTGIAFEAESTGPVAALAGTLTVIAEPVVGWNSVTNPADAEEGLDVESDPALRLRRAAELAASGDATDLALKAAVSSVEGVVSVTVLSNDTDAVDGNGLAPHSQEVIVFDGIVPAADDDEIAQAIWDQGANGIPKGGSSSGTATDVEGGTHTVRFSRVSVETVYLIVDVDVDADLYPGDAALKTALVEWGDANLTQGLDLRYSRVSAATLSVAGVLDVTDIKIGTSPGPVSSSNLSIGARSIADLDTSRITVNSTPVAPT